MSSSSNTGSELVTASSKGGRQLRGLGSRVRLRAGLRARPAAVAARVFPWAFVGVGLSVVTYTSVGYAYRVWPQFFLQYVLRYSGRLVGDWATGFASPHWAFAHMLAWVPPSALSKAAFVLWGLGLVGLWVAFAALGRGLGLSWSGVAGAGLVAASTGFAGLGMSTPVTGFLYPTSLAFAFVVAALAALVYERRILTGLFLGLAVLVHSDMGALGAIAVAPAYLFTTSIRPLRRHGWPVIALVVPALPSVYEALSNQALGSTLSNHRRYELLAVVRAPWHFLYRAFPLSEWAETCAWLVVFGCAILLVRHGRRRRVLVAVVAAIMLVCALGAAASQLGWPLFLVQLQTARLTSLLILVGIVAGFAALHRVIGRFTGLAGVLVFLLAPAVRDGLLGFAYLPARVGELVSVSSVSAGAVVVLIAGFVLAVRGKGSEQWSRPAALLSLGVALVVVAVTLIVPFQTERSATPSQMQRDWAAVATEAKAVSVPGDVFLVPPQQDLFALWADRPVVVTFGSFEFGRGDRQWISRMTIVTGGDPRILSPSYTTDVNARLDLMQRDYDRTIETSRVPICAFSARFVVVESTATAPAWLRLVLRTPTYALYSVRPGTCAGA